MLQHSVVILISTLVIFASGCEEGKEDPKLGRHLIIISMDQLHPENVTLEGKDSLSQAAQKGVWAKQGVLFNCANQTHFDIISTGGCQNKTSGANESNAIWKVSNSETIGVPWTTTDGASIGLSFAGLKNKTSYDTWVKEAELVTDAFSGSLKNSVAFMQLNQTVLNVSQYNMFLQQIQDLAFKSHEFKHNLVIISNTTPMVFIATGPQFENRTKNISGAHQIYCVLLASLTVPRDLDNYCQLCNGVNITHNGSAINCPKNAVNVTQPTNITGSTTKMPANVTGTTKATLNVTNTTVKPVSNATKIPAVNATKTPPVTTATDSKAKAAAQVGSKGQKLQVTGIVAGVFVGVAVAAAIVGIILWKRKKLVPTANRLHSRRYLELEEDLSAGM